MAYVLSLFLRAAVEGHWACPITSLLDAVPAHVSDDWTAQACHLGRNAPLSGEIPRYNAYPKGKRPL
jgi:hypothetical protein